MNNSSIILVSSIVLFACLTSCKHSSFSNFNKQKYLKGKLKYVEGDAAADTYSHVETKPCEVDENERAEAIFKVEANSIIAEDSSLAELKEESKEERSIHFPDRSKRTDRPKSEETLQKTSSQRSPKIYIDEYDMDMYLIFIGCTFLLIAAFVFFGWALYTIALNPVWLFVTLVFTIIHLIVLFNLIWMTHKGQEPEWMLLVFVFYLEMWAAIGGVIAGAIIVS